MTREELFMWARTSQQDVWWHDLAGAVLDMATELEAIEVERDKLIREREVIYFSANVLEARLSATRGEIIPTHYGYKELNHCLDDIVSLLGKLPPTSILGLTITSVAELDLEVCRARAKHPKNALLYEALLEEVCELCGAAISGRPREEVNKEALQVACVAMRIREEGSLVEARGKVRDMANKESMFREFLRSRGTPD